MAKEIKEINFILLGDDTTVVDLATSYKIMDSDDNAMVKGGVVIIEWDDTKTLAQLHTLAKAAIESKEGL